ncbi:MAG: hypothetical protein EXS13_14315 [Planctomycetes bacterium]|nr:hypothetical protein [Planctomycetota bacterium]
MGVPLVAPASAQVLFTDVSSRVGLTDIERSDGCFHGLGITWFDYDDDGFDDLLVVNGKDHVTELYLNRGDATFALQTHLLPTLPNVDLMGAVAGDHDGDVDLAWVDAEIPGTAGGLRLFRNDTPRTGAWLEVRLTGVDSNRSAIGSRITARVGKMQMLRQIVGGCGAHGQNMFTAHFGLGAATHVDEFTIEWPSGAVNRLRHVAVDQLLSIREQVEDHLTLTVDPDTVFAGDTLTFTASGGAPDELVMLAAVDVDGVPTFLEVDLGTFDSDGRRVLAVSVPPCLDGLTVGFRAIGCEAWSARPGYSSVETILFQ